ncbi:formate dehydrogenase accessory sulfurtransferase FdhD [Methanococcus aeolicus]|uniref:formate dehydrogenase accessory sulfurtransferase FdhD n=1 Tax=Methanococcus aeolicus TaxID=42879 RepID=UPI0021C7AABE|nr:formate dehydrogenase accessory sulfurtransferase FdhD [Methanococcus aeolicus]UXM84827.1 formate dehydrogenase accessory sulfurtransferase FdhD [Methanococcus aeolicus]
MDEKIGKVVVKSFNLENNESIIREDFVCIEESYDIYLNGKYISNTVATPDKIKEMAVGYIVSEGIECITADSIKSITVEGNVIYIETNVCNNNNNNNNNNNKYSEKSNDNENNGKNIKLKLNTIQKVIKYMENITGVWKITGGAHWACISDLDGDILINIEDIGRHNAVDKVIGHCILNNIDLTNKILISSGRQPTLMVNKCKNAKIPAIISKSPSTDKGVQIARENNIILIGFARKNKFVAYSEWSRIIQ